MTSWWHVDLASVDGLRAWVDVVLLKAHWAIQLELPKSKLPNLDRHRRPQPANLVACCQRVETQVDADFIMRT